MSRIAVIFYSRSGNTEKMAGYVAEGARQQEGAEVEQVSVEDITPEEALEYDALVIGSPTYYGSMAWQVKKFFDDSVSLHGRFSGKVGAAFSSAANIGGGNETTISGILSAMLIHGMLIQGDHQGDHYGVVSIGAPDERVKDQCRKLGARVAGLVQRCG